MATRVTIQDIANELQLSRNTVSKAINNTGVLADATREKILRKAAEMGYKQFAYLPLFQPDGPPAPEAAAAAPADAAQPDGKREIAMLTTCFLSSSHFSSMMLDRFQSEIHHLHYGMTIYRISPSELAARRMPASFDPERVAGIICFEVFDYAYAQMLCEQGIPLLFVDSPVTELKAPLKADLLYMNNHVEVQHFIQIMHQRGKDRIGFIGEIQHCQSFFERYAAYASAMTQLGLADSLKYCALEGLSPAYFEDALRAMLKTHGLPDVFICANDFVAIDAIRTLHNLGVSVPEDVWICGFDDSQEASVMTPRLTSIHIHGQIMGFTAADLLMTRIKEPSLNYRTVYTETNLILRESTGDHEAKKL